MTGVLIDRQTVRQIDRQIDRQSDRQIDSQIYSQIDSQIDRQIDRQTDRQIDRQIDKHWVFKEDLGSLLLSCNRQDNTQIILDRFIRILLLLMLPSLYYSFNKYILNKMEFFIFISCIFLLQIKKKRKNVKAAYRGC